MLRGRILTWSRCGLTWKQRSSDGQAKQDRWCFTWGVTML